MAGWSCFFALAADAPGQERAWTFTLAFLPREGENSGWEVLANRKPMLLLRLSGWLLLR